MKKTFVLSVVLSGALVASAATVGSGWKIVAPEREDSGVSAAIESAAKELASGLRASTGLDLKVVRGEQGSSPAIWLGAQAATKAGFDTASLKWFDNVIAEKNGDIYIFGGDRTISVGKTHRDWNSCLLPTVRGIARFLQTYGGVDWTLPGATGRTVMQVPPPQIAAGTLSRETPVFHFMAGARVPSMMFSYANGLWGTSTFHTYGGHTFPDACPCAKYYDEHPEYFALIKGVRYKDAPLPPRSHNPHLCISNPAVKELVIAELLRRYDAGADVCELGQEDSFKPCECEACHALYGTGDDWGEKLWLFFREIAERIEKERPGKIVQIISYGPTKDLPKTFKKFPSNVMVELMTSTEEHIALWKDYVVPHGFTVYTYFWGCYPLAGFTAKQPVGELSRRAKSYVANNICGAYFCGYGEAFGMEGPGYYVFSRTILDPKADAGRLLDEYCEKTFGPAAREMRRFYAVLDERLESHHRLYTRYITSAKNTEAEYTYARHGDVLGLLGETYNASARQRMERHLEAALAAPGLDDLQRRRLRLVRLEFSYARNLGEVAECFKRYLATPDEKTARPLADAIAWRNSYLDRLYDGKPTPRQLPDWPELHLFRDYARSYLQANGRNAAAIGAPLDWDPAALKDMYDVKGWKKRDAANRKLKPVTKWTLSKGEGNSVEVSDDGRKIHFVARMPSPGGRAEHRFDKDWKPGAKYRVSWYSKVSGLKRMYIGGCAKGQVTFGSGKEDASQQYLPAMRTTDSDWVHQAIEVTAGDPKASAIRFLLSAIAGEVWIEDVTWEEIGK